MSPTHDIHESGTELLAAAPAFQDSAARPGSSEAADALLGRLEEALGAISGGLYQLAADGAAGISQSGRFRPNGTPTIRSEGGLSREREVSLIATMHRLAAAFAGCARACRSARPTVRALVADKARRERTDDAGRGVTAGRPV